MSPRPEEPASTPSRDVFAGLPDFDVVEGELMPREPEDPGQADLGPADQAGPAGSPEQAERPAAD